jgi:hypothetical protein
MARWEIEDLGTISSCCGTSDGWLTVDTRNVVELDGNALFVLLLGILDPPRSRIETRGWSSGTIGEG